MLALLAEVIAVRSTANLSRDAEMNGASQPPTTSCAAPLKFLALKNSSSRSIVSGSEQYTFSVLLVLSSLATAEFIM